MADVDQPVRFPWPWLVVAFIIGTMAGHLFTPNRDEEITGLRLESERLREQAVGWHRIAAGIQARVDTAVVVVTERQIMVRQATDTILRNLEVQSPECAAIVTTCRERVEVERGIADSWRNLFEDQKRAAIAFRLSADTALAALDSSRRAVSLLVDRDPSFWHRLTHPKLRPGVFVGLCVDSKPCAGAGVGAVWEF